MDKQEKYVSFKIFTWSMSIITLIIGWMLVANSALSARVNEISIDSITIQTQLSQIQTDLSWIKQNINKE